MNTTFRSDVVCTCLETSFTVLGISLNAVSAFPGSAISYNPSRPIPSCSPTATTPICLLLFSPVLYQEAFSGLANPYTSTDFSAPKNLNSQTPQWLTLHTSWTCESVASTGSARRLARGLLVRFPIVSSLTPSYPFFNR